MKLNEDNINLELLDKPTELDIKLHNLIRQVVVNTLISLILLSFVLSLFLTFMIAGKLEFQKSDVYNMLYPKNLIVYDENMIPVAVGDDKNYYIYLNNNEISKNLKNQIVLLEDKSFYKNKGLNLSYIFIDIYNILKNKPVSKNTISSKLAENFEYKTTNIIERKISEMLYSLELENKFSKDELVSIYLNSLSIKNRGNGLDENSNKYFGKEASLLNNNEAKRFVLLLLGKKIIKYSAKHVYTSKYSYFIDYSISEAKKNMNRTDIENFKIYTSLNRLLQRKSENVMKFNLSSLSKLNKNTEGAVLLINSKNGSIISIVGGNDFIKGDFNRAYQSKRAVASTFKPLIFLLALEKKLITPTSILEDEPISFKGKDKKWTPKNWDDEYLGVIDIKKALKFSRNTVAVKLASKVGINEIVHKLKLLGITGNLPNNLSISIGSIGIKVNEWAGVYSTLAREGSYIKPYSVTKILNQNGQEVFKAKIFSKQVFSKKATEQLNHLLDQTSDNELFKKFKKQNIPVYGKTGTSDKSRDLWFSGYNKDFTGVVWIGNDKNLPMNNVYSRSCSAIWSELANCYYANLKK